MKREIPKAVVALMRKLDEKFLEAFELAEEVVGKLTKLPEVPEQETLDEVENLMQLISDAMYGIEDGAPFKLNQWLEAHDEERKRFKPGDYVMFASVLHQFVRYGTDGYEATGVFTKVPSYIGEVVSEREFLLRAIDDLEVSTIKVWK